MMAILDMVVFFIFLYLIYKVVFKIVPAGLRRFLMNFAIRRIIMMAIFKGLR